MVNPLTFHTKPETAVQSAAHWLRILWAIFFLCTSLPITFSVLTNPQFYQTAAEQVSAIPFFRQLLLQGALPNAVLVAGLTMSCELAFGLMALGKGERVRWGLLGTALCWYSVLSPILFLFPLWLARYHYDRTWNPLSL